jgi:hypothetical protein
MDCRAMKAMPDQLILKRDPDTHHTESYNIAFDLTKSPRGKCPWGFVCCRCLRVAHQFGAGHVS